MTNLPSKHTQNTCANIIEDEHYNHLQPLTTIEIPTKKQAPPIDTEHRLPPSRYNYKESRTHGLIIKHPDQYSLDTNKYRPNDPEWRTAWKHILEHHDDDFAPSFFCFKFPLQTKTLTSKTPRQHGKLRRKIIRELKRKFKDVDHYMSQSLHDLKKAKRPSDKRAQRHAQAIRDTKQDADRARFRQQAEAETEESYAHSTLSPTAKAIHLENERKATNQRGDNFASW